MVCEGHLMCESSIKISLCTRCMAAELHMLYDHFVRSLSKDNNSDTQW